MSRVDASQLRQASDRSGLPVFSVNALYVILVAAAVSSVPRIGQYSPLPITTLLDVWVIVFMLACLVSGRVRGGTMLFLLIAYFLTRLIPALSNESPLEDFFRAYRWVLYLMAFVLAIGREWGPLRPLIRITWALLILALVKAALTFALLGPGERPGLLTENNFELALFSGLVALLYKHLGQHRPWAVVLLGALTIASGSRSGAIAFVILALYATTQAKSVTLLVKYLLACLLPLLVIVPVAIFSQRAGSSNQIDRINFLNVFLNETRDWTALNWLLGTVPITPLSEGCAQLSYYQLLFSSVGDGSCYAVILHAFLLRVIFDAGILGVVIYFGVTWWAMRKAGVTVGLAVCIIFIALTNSVSVSGLNSPYVMLTVLLTILTAKHLAVSPSPFSKEIKLKQR
jgi:hypothetical protein